MNSLHLSQHDKKGAAMLTFVVLFLFGSLILVFGVGRGVYQDLIRYKTLEEAKVSFFGVEAGIEDAIHRHRRGKEYSGTESFDIGGVNVETERDTGVDYFDITVAADLNNIIRKGWVQLTLGNGASFNFGLQSGNGGIEISNNSSVQGNVFSNGTVFGQGNATVYGDVIAAGPSGLVDGIHATGSMWSHTINDSDIDGDAYYYSTGTLIATVVDGTKNPGSPDQATATMPVSDSTIDGWKQEIEDTGSTIASTDPECSTGTYVIDSTMTIGNLKIECNLEIKKTGGSVIVTLEGPIWIEGNLTFTQGPEIVASSSIGNKSVQMIADNENNRSTSSVVTVAQSTNFSGTGGSKSYVFIVSMNNDAENGGSATAIDISNSANGDILVYASHGLVSLGNNISLKEVTAYKINLAQGAQVIYESGLVSLLFTGGPGGGFAVTKWTETE